jgi:hypothetical protein
MINVDNAGTIILLIAAAGMTGLLVWAAVAAKRSPSKPAAPAQHRVFVAAAPTPAEKPVRAIRAADYHPRSASPANKTRAAEPASFTPARHEQSKSRILRSDDSKPVERDTSADFAIGFMTGIPMPSSSGIMGALLHTSTAHSTPAPASDPTPSYSSPAPDPTPSYCPAPAADFSSSTFDSSHSVSCDVSL